MRLLKNYLRQNLSFPLITTFLFFLGGLGKSLVAMELLYSYRTISFDTLSDGSQIRPGLIQAEKTTSGGNNAHWVEKGSAGSHSLSTLSLNIRGLSGAATYYGAPEGYIENMHLDIMTNFSFEFLHFRGQLDAGYMFTFGDFLSVGPAMGMYFASMLSKSLFFDASTMNLKEGEKNDLYLRTNPVSKQSEFLSSGPLMLGINAGIQLSFYLLKYLPIEFIYMSPMIEYGTFSTATLNTLAGHSDLIANFNGPKFRAQLIDIRFTFLPEQMDLSFVPVVLGYRYANYQTVAASDSGIYFGVLFETY